MTAERLAAAGLAASLFFLLLLGVLAIVQTIRVGRWRHRCELLQVMYRERTGTLQRHRPTPQRPLGERRRPHRTGTHHEPTAVQPAGEETVALTLSTDTVEVQTGGWSR